MAEAEERETPTATAQTQCNRTQQLLNLIRFFAPRIGQSGGDKTCGKFARVGSWQSQSQMIAENKWNFEGILATNERRQRKRKRKKIATTTRHPARACYISDPVAVADADARQQQSLGYNFQRHFLLLFPCDTNTRWHTGKKNIRSHTPRARFKAQSQDEAFRIRSVVIFSIYFWWQIKPRMLIADRARSRSRTPVNEIYIRSLSAVRGFVPHLFCFESIFRGQIHTYTPTHTHTNARISHRRYMRRARAYTNRWILSRRHSQQTLFWRGRRDSFENLLQVRVSMGLTVRSHFNVAA